MPTLATGLKISIANTPQAKDDVYGALEDFEKLLDVLCNDLGGEAKTLYALSKYLTIEDGGTVTSASMISGTPLQTITTNLGATATIVDGKINYVTNNLDFLAEGESRVDVFSYIIRLANGAFSIATVSVTVSGSNDAPDIHFVTGDSAAAGLTETNAALTATGTLTITDIDTLDTVDVAVTDVVASGTGGTGGLSNDDLKAMLSLSGHVDNAANGTAGSLGWSFDSGSQAFNYLAQGETLILTYTLTATDNAPLNPLSDTQTVTITITGSNDAPVLTVTATGSLAEDGADPILSTSGSLGIADPDATDTHVITTGVTSVVWSGGILSAADQAGLAAGFSADADSWDFSVANSAVQFLDDGETIVLTFAVTATDDSGAANNSDTETVTVTITGANDAPELTGTAAILPGGLEDNSYTVTQAQLLAGWTDVDGEALTASGLTATNGTVLANADGSYTITPSANYNGPVTLNYSVGDGTATVAASLSYVLAPVNDAPSGADKTVTILEDGSHGFVAADFGFVDAVEGDALAAVIITTLPGAGSLTLNGVAVTAGQAIAAADIGGLRFTPAANANGAGYASFTFQVRDNGGTVNGGVDTDPTPNTISFNVTSVNDAPSGANNTVTANEDATYQFSAADFGFTDPNDGAAPNALAAVRLTTLPGNGSLTLNGSAVAAGQLVSIADINAGLLVFTPAANANGVGYASFTFQVRDNGGTANGGADTDPSPNTITINVTPVNDAPANTVPGAQSVDEDMTLAIAGVSVGDIDSTSLTTTLSVANGTLDVANIVGLSISGDGTGTVTLTGTAAQINLALAGLSYTGSLDYFGPDTLTVETDDGDLTDTDTVAITVNPVADLPVETRVNSAADDKDFDLYTDVAALAAVAMGTTNGTTAADLLVGTNQPSGNETINGNNGNDIIHGAGGTDTINGNNHDDTLYGGAGADLVNGGGGNDAIYGGSGNDTLTGVAGTETFYGGSGNDDIRGGADADQLWGGTGQDDFIFSVGDSSVATRDRINDFSHAEDDNIDLTAFANFTAGDWLGAIANAGALTSGALGYVVNLDGSLTIYGDHDGNGVADFALDIIGVGSLQTGDFIFGGP